MNQKATRKEIFESAPPVRAILTLAVPTVINQLVNVVYNLSDTFFIGQLNDPAMVAAVSLSAPIMLILTALGNLFSVGGCSLISRALGVNDPERANRLTTLCILLAASMGLCVTGLTLLFLEPLAGFAGAAETNLDYTKQYLFWAVGLNAVPMLCSLAIGSSLRGRGFSKKEMFGLTFSNILNVVLDPIFIFVFDLGVQGAAAATFLSTCVSLAYFTVFLFRNRRRELMLCPLKQFRPEWNMLSEVVLTGLPATINTLLNSVSNTIYLNSVNQYADAGVAAAGIVRKIEKASGQVVVGLNQGTIPLIAYNYANENYERMEAIRRRTLQIGMIWGVITILVFAPVPSIFIRAFIRDAETVEYGSLLLRISSVIPLLMFYNNAQRTFLQALGRKKESLRISIERQLAFYIPLLLILGRFFGLAGAACAAPAADFLSDVSAAVCVRPVWAGILRQAGKKRTGR